MSHLDRLSSLLNNFEVRSSRTSSPEASNLFIIGQQQKVEKLVLYIDGVRIRIFIVMLSPLLMLILAAIQILFIKRCRLI
jgi:hypothetical protein